MHDADVVIAAVSLIADAMAISAARLYFRLIKTAKSRGIGGRATGSNWFMWLEITYRGPKEGRADDHE